MIKVLRNVSIKGIYFNIIKIVCKKSTAKIILNEKNKLEEIQMKSRTGQ